MGAVRMLRFQPIWEDAGERGYVFVELHEDWPEEWVSLEDIGDPVIPWRCEECAQLWPAEEIACGYCGTERED